MKTSRREEWMIPTLSEPISHYTHAVSFGDLVFVSGLVATDEQGRVSHPDVEQQADQILRDLGMVLRAAGSDLHHVLKVTVFLLDIGDRERINAIRQRFFGSVRPASTLVEVSKLAVDGVRIEIEAVAAKIAPVAAEGLQPNGDALPDDQ